MDKQIKKQIFEEVKKYGNLQAKEILGSDGLPDNFIDSFLEGDSLFTNIINKTIDLTEEKLKGRNKGLLAYLVGQNKQLKGRNK